MIGRHQNLKTVRVALEPPLSVEFRGSAAVRPSSELHDGIRKEWSEISRVLRVAGRCGRRASTRATGYNREQEQMEKHAHGVKRPNDPSSATRRRGGDDGNRDAAAHG